MDLLTGAMHQLHANIDAMAPTIGPFWTKWSIGELRRLSEHVGQGNTERHVKSSHASMNQRSRSRHPAPTNKTP